MRFSPESPIRDCDSIILNLRAYIRTRLQLWSAHFAENNPRPKRSTRKQQSTYAMQLENRICKKAKVLGKAPHVDVPYPVEMVCRTERKARKAPGKTPEAVSLIKGEDRNDRTAPELAVQRFPVKARIITISTINPSPPLGQ